ncbi:MAG TPA: hypothetical protein VHD62_17905 [Opitutaceae bacterium]|nr:hypothetical protein [Opitutaceae bacterium]
MIETAACLFLLTFVGAVLFFFYFGKRIYRHRPRGNGDSLLANLFSEAPAAQPAPIPVRSDERR